MSEKRKHSSAFQVGPANLPDGTRKRKADRIKQALIDRAKIKQDFAKVKKRRLQDEQGDDVLRRNVYEDAEPEDPVDVGEEDASAEALPAEPHPDRQALMDREEEQPQQQENSWESRSHQRDHRRRQKQDPYATQLSYAQRQKADADQRQQARAEAERQREQKLREREKMHRLIKRAKRPTMDGKRKLGRESEVLLEKVKRMMKG